MGAISDSFLLLQRLARTFDLAGELAPGQRRAANRWVRLLGPTAIPLCLRELTSESDERAGWAFTLLVAIADAGHQRRVVDDARRLAQADGSDAGKLHALGLLSELGADDVHVVLADPVAARARSMQRLARGLLTRADVAQAAGNIASQLDPDEVAAFLRDLTRLDRHAGDLLARELLYRDHLDPELRAVLDGLVRHRRPAELPRDRTRLQCRVATHPDGHRLVVGWRRRPGTRPARCRSTSALIDEHGELVVLRYSDDVSGRATEDELLGRFLARGFSVASRDVADARAHVLGALAALPVDQRLPEELYLGRDLFGIELGVPLRAPRATAVHVDRVLDLALEAYRDRDLDLAESLFEQAGAVGDERAVSGLGLCALARGDLDRAEAAFIDAAARAPASPDSFWNLGALAHHRSCRGSCFIALSAYLDKADPNDPRRAHAVAFVTEFERLARLFHPDCDPMAVACADRDHHHGQRALAGGDLSEARACFERAVRRVPSHGASWTALALLASRCGESGEATRCTRQALAANPADPEALALSDFLTRARAHGEPLHAPA